MNETILICAALATSVLTAISGVGGGMILIALMPGFLPPAAIVPVHAAVQLVANSSRAFFGWRFLRWEFVTMYAAGSLLGGALAAGLTTRIDLDYIPLLIAAYILYSVWAPGFKWRRPPRWEFAAIGTLQTGLGMIVGATGPLGQAAMARRGLQRDSLVVTTALTTLCTHAVKLAFFAVLGFVFADYWQLVLGMSLGVIAGSYIGTRIRYRIPEDLFRRVLRWLLTLLALRMIVITLYNQP